MLELTETHDESKAIPHRVLQAAVNAPSVEIGYPSFSAFTNLIRDQSGNTGLFFLYVPAELHTNPKEVYSTGTLGVSLRFPASSTAIIAIENQPQVHCSEHVYLAQPT